jgi:hypothetical protein
MGGSFEEHDTGFEEHDAGFEEHDGSFEENDGSLRGFALSFASWARHPLDGARRGGKPTKNQGTFTSTPYVRGGLVGTIGSKP